MSAKNPLFPTLEELRDHAAANPTKRYNLSSCSACLACDLTGCNMAGHQNLVRYNEDASVADRGQVPRAFAEMTRTCQDHIHTQMGTGAYYTGIRPTGQQIAEKVQALIDGHHPFDVGIGLAEAALKNAPEDAPCTASAMTSSAPSNESWES